MNPTIHLIFKTHLDLGFTDYAANVAEAYFRGFIPQAIALAKRTHESGGSRFRWTTGAWLIYQYLERASAKECRAMQQAIEAGDILWHALPFTTHTELMDASLFRFGLSFSQKLDQRFGRRTVAAKMTDVPGHTRAMVPLLAEAGIRLLHIGVNPASSVPDVPPVFVWRDVETDTSVIVIYHETYGGVTTIPGSDDALAVILTGDNQGPPSDAEVLETYETLKAKTQDAHVIASTLDDFALTLDTASHHLPVITSEIGDTWIHGVGSDPTKVRRYRELCRLRREWLARPLSANEQECIDRFSQHLILIPEHTWGMDEKTHLADDAHYEASDLARMRKTEHWRRFEASWAEQHGYVGAALETLAGSSLADEAEQRLSDNDPRLPDLTRFTETDAFTLRSERFEIFFDPQTGAIQSLVDQQTAIKWANETHSLAALTYEVFGQEDYDRFWTQYIRNRNDPSVEAWARQDFTKPGMTNTRHMEWQPVVNDAYREGNKRILFALMLPDESRRFGAPDRLFLGYEIDGNAINLKLSWFDKPACRLPEACWLSFQPSLEPMWHFEKMGRWIDPGDVVSRGGRGLHAIDQRVVAQNGSHTFEITSLDAPLVAPGRRSLLNFHNQLPDGLGGVHVNLYNNVWGTNFPMWFEDDASFRFILRFS